MSITFQTLPGLKAIVTKVVYDPTLNAPPDRPYPFVYFITLRNDSEETVTIFGRKWIVHDTDGRIEVYEGDGVVGQFPRLEPGKKFKYNSYHTVGCESRAQGSFFGATEKGVPVVVQAEEFTMQPPLMA